MKADMEIDFDAPAATGSKRFVGRFVRKQGQFGTVAVVGSLLADRVDVIADTKKLFPKDGLVETQGLGHHVGLRPGDWVEFDIVRNPRPRAPEYKVLHLNRLPRFASLPDLSLPAYRVLLTGDGWQGDARPGPWAFRIAGDTVIVADMEIGKDGRLHVAKASAREVKRYAFDAASVVDVGKDASDQQIFIAPLGGELPPFDWSDEADHIARVVRALAGANDTRFAEIVTWLDLHHEEGTGRVSAASANSKQALEALRSGELADRLRADRELMDLYLAAALGDDAVREAVAAYAKEGHGAERDRLRSQLSLELAAERTRLLDALTEEVAAERDGRLARIDGELRQYEAAARAMEVQRREAARLAAQAEAKRVVSDAADRAGELERAIADQSLLLEDKKAEVADAEAKRDGVLCKLDAALKRVETVRTEVDRLLAISARLDSPATAAAPTHTVGGLNRVFPVHPLVPSAKKGELIGRHVMLSGEGREKMSGLLVAMLSGELPILMGDRSIDLLTVAEAVVCPGRLVVMDADPALISIDDLWARPGSGAPTMFARAAEAARDGGSVIVVIRGIERSGARFWFPALADALRSGGLPRGLLVCCTLGDEEHDEAKALPADVVRLAVSDVFKEGAASAAPSLLTPPRIDLEVLDPGLLPVDLSAGNAIALEVGEGASLGLTMRVARMFTEALAVLGEDAAARRIVLKIAKSLVPKGRE